MGIFKNKYTKTKNNTFRKKLPLLQVFLSAMPEKTQIQLSTRFAKVKANFEFGTWIPVFLAERYVNDSIQKGFQVWCNTETSSAFLYGAGWVSKKDQASIIIWLQDITQPGQKGQIMIKHLSPPIQMITFYSSGVEPDKTISKKRDFY
jgi:hypothetical protein